MSRWTAALRILLAVVTAAVPGCAGYQVGADTLYPLDVRTVSVQMFESNSYRRNLGERLTEAVVKQIEAKTPYKVVNGLQADSVLTGRILADTKRVTAVTPADQPRATDVAMSIEVQWLDRRSNLLGEGRMPMPSELVKIVQDDLLVPETGQSVAVAQQRAIERLADEIVSLMEAPW